jgi:hypothetical protein
MSIGPIVCYDQERSHGVVPLLSSGTCNDFLSQSRWLCGLRRRCATARLLGSRVQIPLEGAKEDKNNCLMEFRPTYVGISVLFFVVIYVFNLFIAIDSCWGTRWRSSLRHCDTSRSRVRFAVGYLTASFRPNYASGVYSASNRNEYRGYIFAGGGG